MGYEIQKIFTAILVVFLFVFGIGKISDFVFKTEKNVVSYKVEVEEKTSESSQKSDLDIEAFLAMGTVDHGKSTFKKCKACHSINKGGKNNIGPALYNVMVRNAGGLTDYKYSKSLLAYGKKWTVEELNGFLIKPSTWIKGNKMGFAGLKNEKDRASVILYLNQNSDNPLQLP
tara:strand:- start:118 stop:636 length:519 start_codon:yes stop_codon:yes gene_type:complete